MKSLPFDMIAIHIQAEFPSLLGALEHTLQHFWGNCTHRCQNAFTQVPQIPNLHLAYLNLDVTPGKEVQGHYIRWACCPDPWLASSNPAFWERLVEVVTHNVRKLWWGAVLLKHYWIKNVGKQLGLQELLKHVQIRCWLWLLLQHIYLWYVTFQFHGDVWLFINPYPAVVVTGMKVSHHWTGRVPTNVHCVLSQLIRGTLPFVPHGPQILDDGAPGCDKSFSSVRSAGFVTQWTLGCRVPDWNDVSSLFDSAWSPVMSTTAQNVSHHTETCW